MAVRWAWEVWVWSNLGTEWLLWGSYLTREMADHIERRLLNKCIVRSTKVVPATKAARPGNVRPNGRGFTGETADMRPCEVCKRPFKPNRAGQINCSVACSSARARMLAKVRNQQSREVRLRVKAEKKGTAQREEISCPAIGRTKAADQRAAQPEQEAPPAQTALPPP